MEQYNKLLVARYNVTQEIDSISRQNDELKALDDALGGVDASKRIGKVRFRDATRETVPAM